MKTLSWLIAGVAAVALALPAFGATPEETAVIDTVMTWHKAYNDQDLETLRRLLADDAMMVSNSLKRTVGKTEYLEGSQNNFQKEKSKFVSRDERLLDIKVVTIKGDQAERVKRAQLTINKLGDRGPSTHEYVTENKLRLENGVWRIYFQKTSQAK